MNIEYLKKNNLIIYECVSGSQAYGTANENSDTDIRGVFVMPHDMLLGMEYVEQVNDETNDTTYYELKRFLQLLSVNNPNILELLNSPQDCILSKHDCFDEVLLNSEKFLTKICKSSFAGYASTQIGKARGLNKKITKTFERIRKSPLEFCYVSHQNGSLSVREFAELRGIELKHLGATGIDHMKNCYHLYHGAYCVGLFKDELSTNLMMTSVPKGEMPIATFYFNVEAFSVYCREYKEYWDWDKKKNIHRYAENVANGKGYDGKNILHCFRLLQMAIEIGEGKGINVRRSNREELLAIRKGERDYDELMISVNELMSKIETVYSNSNLPESVESEFVNQLCVNVRKKFYGIR